MLIIVNDPMMLELKDTEVKVNDGCLKAYIHFGALKDKIDFETKEVQSVQEFDDLIERLEGRKK